MDLPDLSRPPWPWVDERGLARYVTVQAARHVPLGVSRYDLAAQPERYRLTARAVYEALRERDIRYAPEAYHPSDALQEIRTPSEVLISPREGTCLDLAALFAGLCLCYELLPVLIVVDGHALVAVSATHGVRDWNAYDRAGRELFIAGPVTDAAALRDLIREGAYLAVECTGFAQRAGGTLSFEQAVAAGARVLEERPLQFALDVAIAHFGWRIEPYPLQPLPGAHSTDIYRLLAQAPAALTRDLPALGFERLLTEKTRGFVGREFCFAAIDQVIASQPSGYVLVRGEPGAGKTSLLAQLVKTRGYVHHFNIAAEGIRSTRAFTASLCAQLIVRYRLDHAAIPPDGLDGSAFLSRLLTESVAKERPIVVAVDALDEAEDEDTAANRLHLPATLPDGVFFVLTSREQLDYRLVVSRRTDLYIRDDDPRNLADIRAYILSYLQAHPQVASRLAAWEVNAGQFTDVITERSQGNFMYLVQVLDDIRDGRISPETIDSVHGLPLGLHAYYEQHWRMMRAYDTSRFERFYEPVLQILATVREAVTLSDIGQWTGVAPARIHEVIRAWRPFLNETPGSEPRYRIYHASFQDFLAEEGAGLQRFHERIGLAALQGIPLPYERRNAIAHLAEAGSTTELRELLSAVRPDGRNRWWGIRFQAGETAGYLADLDLARRAANAPALQLRYALMSSSVRAPQEKVSPTLLRALLGASVWTTRMAYDHARGTADPKKRLELLLAVIAYDTTPVRQDALPEALGTARSARIASAELLALLEPAARRELAAGLLARPGDRGRGVLLSTLAPVIAEFPQLLVVAGRIARAKRAIEQDPDTSLAHGFTHQEEAEQTAYRAASREAEHQLDLIQCLLALAEADPSHRADLLSEAVTVAEAITAAKTGKHAVRDFYARSAIEALSRHIRGRTALVQRAAACVGSLENLADRGRALAALVPLMSREVARQTADAALGIARGLQSSDRIDAVEIMARLAVTLDPAQRARVLQDALNVTALIRDDQLNHYVAIIELAPHLAGDERLLGQALELLALDTPLSASWRSAALRELAGPLAADKGLIERAVEIAASISDPADRADALAATTASLPAQRRSALLRGVLAELSPIRDELPCSRALAALAGAAAEPKNVPEILDVAATLPTHERVRVLTSLAHHLPDSDAAAVVETTIGLARSIDHVLYAYAYAMGELATPTLLPRLQEPLLEALEATRPGYGIGFAFTDAVMAVLPHIAQCSPEAVTVAMTYLLSLPEHDELGHPTRAYVLACVTAHLNGKARRQAVSAVLSAAPEMREQSMLRGEGRAELLALIGPYLAKDPDLAEQSLALAIALEGHRQRSHAVLCALPALHDQPALLARAVDALLNLPATLPNGEPLRSSSLLAAMPALAAHPGLRQLARDAIAANPSATLHLEFSGHAGTIPGDLLARAIAVPEPASRVQILAQIRPALSAAQLQAATSAVLAAMPDLGSSGYKSAAAFCGESPQLADLLLRECDKLTHIYERPLLFTAILEHYDLTTRGDLPLQVALNTEDLGSRRRMLQILTAHVPRTFALTWWQALVDGIAAVSRPDRIGDLEAGTAIIAVLGGPDLALALAKEIVAVRSQWP